MLPSGDVMTCYQLIPLLDTAGLARTNAVCLVQNSRSETGAPNFKLQLGGIFVDEAFARKAMLTWESPDVVTGYLLVTLHLEGAARETAFFYRWENGRSVSMGDGPTCFTVGALSNTNLIGHTDILCVFPGMATGYPELESPAP
jgi:hypothetical protein